MYEVHTLSSQGSEETSQALLWSGGSGVETLSCRRRGWDVSSLSIRDALVGEPIDSKKFNLPSWHTYDVCDCVKL